jgi:hypothetical protein
VSRTAQVVQRARETRLALRREHAERTHW